MNSSYADHQIAVKGRNEIQVALGRDRDRVRFGFVEIAAVLDQLGAEGAHGRVLFDRVSIRNHDAHSDTCTRGCKRERLAMVAARCADHAFALRPLAHGTIDIDEPAAQFERPDGSVVLVLDNDIHSRARAQERPGILGRLRHMRAYHGNCML